MVDKTRHTVLKKNQPARQRECKNECHTNKIWKSSWLGAENGIKFGPAQKQ